MNITCDNCGEVFKLNQKVKYRPKGIQEHYFKCKHCDKHYTTFFTDKKVRGIQKEMKRTTDVSKRQELAREVEVRKEKLMQGIGTR